MPIVPGEVTLYEILLEKWSILEISVSMVLRYYSAKEQIFLVGTCLS
jgi:hypothetical protein